MCQVAVNIPDEVLFGTNMSIEDAAVFARQMTALGYYTKGNVSLGYCAEIAGMHKAEFMRFLGSHGVSIFRFDGEEEFFGELGNA